MPNPKTEKHAQKIHQLETTLTPPIQLKRITDSKFSLTERMAHYKVPGVSIALIENGEIAWTKTWGMADNSSHQLLSYETLFQAASISKPIAALCALKMVEIGDLSLELPINQFLKRWQLPDNEFTQQ